VGKRLTYKELTGKEAGNGGSLLMCGFLVGRRRRFLRLWTPAIRIEGGDGALRFNPSFQFRWRNRQNLFHCVPESRERFWPFNDFQGGAS
jgi:hypothetical protein